MDIELPSLSVILITRNEAANIRECLESVAWADEIIVVDSGSTDDTVAIARAMGANGHGAGGTPMMMKDAPCPSLTPVPPLMELLANRLGGKAAESLVIPEGEGYGRSLRVFHVKVYEHDWPGFGPQKNRALAYATGDWVFSIDADERVTQQLRAELERAMREGAADGYYCPRLSQFCGTYIHHSGCTADARGWQTHQPAACTTWLKYRKLAKLSD